VDHWLSTPAVINRVNDEMEIITALEFSRLVWSLPSYKHTLSNLI